MPSLKNPLTVVEWIERLESFPHCNLSFLHKQRSALGYNGEAYDAAVSFLIHKKREAGEKEQSVAKRAKCHPYLEEDVRGEFVVTHVSSGPKGQTTRVKVPAFLFMG